MNLIILAPVTGQTRFYIRQSKDTDNVPCNYLEDEFSQGCLDAPEYILTGFVHFQYSFPMVESFDRETSDESKAKLHDMNRNTRSLRKSQAKL